MMHMQLLNGIPASVHQSFITIKHRAYENAKSFGADPNRMVVMGDSAGGNFAAGICLKNSEAEIPDFKVIYQILIYPSVDLRPNVVRPSKELFYTAWFYSSKQSKKFREAYLEDMFQHSLDYRASPFLYNGNI